MNYVISRKSDPSKAETVDQAQLLDACARLSEDGKHPLDIVQQSEAPKLNSTFEKQVSDSGAKLRIEAQHVALVAKCVGPRSGVCCGERRP
jgi:hypothetical protein